MTKAFLSLSEIGCRILEIFQLLCYSNLSTLKCVLNKSNENEVTNVEVRLLTRADQ